MDLSLQLLLLSILLDLWRLSYTTCPLVVCLYLTAGYSCCCCCCCSSLAYLFLSSSLACSLLSLVFTGLSFFSSLSSPRGHHYPSFFFALDFPLPFPLPLGYPPPLSTAYSFPLSYHSFLDYTPFSLLVVLFPIFSSIFSHHPSLLSF